MPISRFSLSLCLMLIIALSPAVMAQPSCNPEGTDNAGTSVDDDADGLIEICTRAGLNAIRYQLDGTGYKATAGGTKVTSGCPGNDCKGYELINNLDFSGYNYPNNLVAWLPIGTNASPFTSTFEGNNHTINKLRIQRRTTLSVGLFSVISSSARIANIGLLNVDVTGASNASGLVGLNNGTITNSYVAGTVTGSDRIGSLVGQNDGTITNSYATGTVRGNSDVGGLVGWNASTIINSYAGGVVISNSSLAGGLVSTNSAGGTITNSYATGAVIVRDNVAGGLVGSNNNDGTITNSYATGTVTGNSSIGGLVGRNINTITNSYATGTVTGSGTNVGGLVGGNFGGTITSSYWNKETSMQTSSAGSSTSAGLTTAQLQSPTAPNATSPARYTNWNTDDWDFGTASDYPALKYARGSDTENPACYQSGDSGPKQPTCGTVLPRQDFLSTINTTATVVVGSDKMAVEFDDIAEGDTVELDSQIMERGSLIFRWTEEGSNITSELDKTKATLQFTVPTAYAGTMTSRTLIFRVSVTDGVHTAQQRIELNVKQKDNGSIMNLVAPTYDSNTRQLNAPTFSANDDPDGVDEDTITYQWQRCAAPCLTNANWTNIAGATMANYTVPQGTSGQTQFRVQITYQDTQGYQRTLSTISIQTEGIRMRLKLFLGGALP